MNSQNALLRAIPKVDELLALPEMADVCMRASHFAVTSAIRETLDAVRADILAGARTNAPTAIELLPLIAKAVEQKSLLGLRSVINGTGVVLHTNFGRAPLAKEAAEAAFNAAMGYSTLEYDVERGERGKRAQHVERLLKELTGAEDALVVNNNAAAMLLVLSSMAQGSEVAVSRGELVEIGGSFRVPDILKQSGCTLLEVGTTNKTRLSDYESAVEAGRTGAFLKVHTSNFKIVGFTEETSLASLAELAKKHDIPLIHDLGSGALIGLEGCDEPTVLGSVEAGADVVCFSGDKLLGGPQAGIVLGKARYLESMKRHPLMRALRLDKMALAALEATLRLYRDPRDAVKRIPAFSMLNASYDALKEKAIRLARVLEAEAPSCSVKLIDAQSEVGGGSAPNHPLPSAAVAISPRGISVEALEERLRLSEPPVIGRIARNEFLLDVRTLDEGDFPIIAARLTRALGGEAKP